MKQFRSISKKDVEKILAYSKTYSDSNHTDVSSLYEDLDKSFAKKQLWYGVFESNKCMAIAFLMDIKGDGIILLANFKSFVKGYGKVLLENILNRSKNIWWCAEPKGGDSLVEYYRQFGLNEHLIKMSKWTDTPEWAFYKTSSKDAEEKIIDILEKADKTSDKFVSSKLNEEPKIIDFPQEEIPSLKKQSTIITHRVSSDANKFCEGDIVLTPWNARFKVVKKVVIGSVGESPFIDFLTDRQKQYLDEFDVIAVLTLEKDFQLDFNSLFNECVRRYQDKFGFDLSYMTYKVDSQPLYTNGKPCYEHSPDECGGDWTELGFIRLNPDMKSVMTRYGIACSAAADLTRFAKIIIAHELAHEIWNNIADESFKFEILDMAINSDFTTKYLKTVKHNKLDEETFCEFLANYILK